MYCVIADPRDPLVDSSEVPSDDLKERTVPLPASGFFTSHNKRIVVFLDTNTNSIEIEEQVKDINTLPILIQTNDWVGISFRHLSEYHGSELQSPPLIGFDLKTPYGALCKTNRYEAPLRH